MPLFRHIFLLFNEHPSEWSKYTCVGSFWPELSEKSHSCTLHRIAIASQRCGYIFFCMQCYNINIADRIEGVSRVYALINASVTGLFTFTYQNQNHVQKPDQQYTHLFKLLNLLSKEPCFVKLLDSVTECFFQVNSSNSSSPTDGWRRKRRG